MIKLTVAAVAAVALLAAVPLLNPASAIVASPRITAEIVRPARGATSDLIVAKSNPTLPGMRARGPSAIVSHEGSSFAFSGRLHRPRGATSGHLNADGK